MTEPRLIACRACDGQGRWEVYTGGWDQQDGSPLGYEETCEVCGGSGGEEIEPDPITMDDLDEIAGLSDEGVRV